MKKLKHNFILLVLMSIIVLLETSCNILPNTNKSTSGSKQDETESDLSHTNDLPEDYEKILLLVDNYNINNTYGYEYKNTQTLDTIVTNSFSVSVKLNSNRTKGQRTEDKKTLNSDFTDEQYIIISKTVTYDDGKLICDGKKSDITLEDFAQCLISDFYLIDNSEYFENFKLEKVGKYKELSFSVDKQDIKEFLGVSSEIKDIKIMIKSDTKSTKLISFNLSYSQELTSTEFDFTPIYTPSSL